MAFFNMEKGNSLLNFETFCGKLQASGLEPQADRLIRLIYSSFEQKMPLKPRFHKKAMQLWLTYLITGGTEESVDAFLEAVRAESQSAITDGDTGPAAAPFQNTEAGLIRGFRAADIRKREILGACRAEIDAIRPRYRSRVAAIYEKLPEFLSGNEKKVNFRRITEGTYGDQYAPAFEWMENSGIFLLCRRTGDPNAGLAMTASDGSVKCYLADTGLLLSHAYPAEELADGSIYSAILRGKLSMDGSMLFENAAAQALAARGRRLFYYVQYSRESHRNEIAIDFVIQDRRGGAGSRIIPVEVKTGRNYSAVSMQRFREKYRSRISDCYIVHPRNLEEKDGIWCIPPYMTDFI